MDDLKDIFSGQSLPKRLTLLVGISALLCSLYVSRVVKKEMYFDFSREMNELGYDLQNHTVTTSDGYILSHHRIVPRNTTHTSRRNVVVLVHGMMGKSSQWICMGPRHSLAYNLLKEGYDTWLLNLRGNSISDYHQNITSSSVYWKHTWDDMGRYDLPASIDYILQVTGKKSIHYVGYSMGASLFFVLLSDRPEYSMKINKMVALGPAVYDVNIFRSYPTVYYLNRLLSDFSELTNIRPPKFPGYTCNSGWDVFCAILMKDRFETYDPNINQAKLDEMMHLSMGTGSMLLVSHFYQNFKAGKFMKYDYGPRTNLQVYGQEVPLEYNLTAVQVPVAIFYAKDDQTCPPEGIERLITKLPNVEMTELIMTKGFSHSSFFMSEKAKELINDKLIKYLLTAARQRSVSPVIL